jgi:hypothetical protein
VPQVDRSIEVLNAWSSSSPRLIAMDDPHEVACDRDVVHEAVHVVVAHDELRRVQAMDRSPAGRVEVAVGVGELVVDGRVRRGLQQEIDHLAADGRTTDRHVVRCGVDPLPRVPLPVVAAAPQQPLRRETGGLGEAESDSAAWRPSHSVGTVAQPKPRCPAAERRSDEEREGRWRLGQRDRLAGSLPRFGLEGVRIGPSPTERCGRPVDARLDQRSLSPVPSVAADDRARRYRSVDRAAM